jgi:hypothetical protein
LSTREQLGLGLALMVGRFVSPADPPLVIWLLGHGAAGAATGLVLLAAWRSRTTAWCRPTAALGALVYQLGVMLAWGAPMDTQAAQRSAPVLLCAGGAVAVALATLRWPGRDGYDRDDPAPAWPGAVAVGGTLGFAALALGAGRLFALDIASLMGRRGGGGAGGTDAAQMQQMMQMMGGGGMGGMGGDPSPMMEMMGGGGVGPSTMSTLLPLVVVLVLVTPLAIGALALTRLPHQAMLATAAFISVALVPLLASGGIGTAVVLGVLVGVTALAVVRLGVGVSSSVTLPAVLLAGSAVAAGVHELPFVAGIALYGALLGGLVHLVGHWSPASADLIPRLRTSPRRPPGFRT